MNGVISALGKGRRSLTPLQEKPFRRIWLASLLSSLGQFVFSVAAAWEMTRLSDMPSMIALVQTAMMVPLMVVTLPAGALADMFDRRKIAMLGLSISAVSAALLAGMGLLELLSPWLLLASCVLVGTGSAIYIPAWQSSIAEQVSRENLAAAVGLSSVSGNVARSVGPALGGAIILFAGAKAAFALTASLFIPLLLAYFLWNRRHLPSRLPPERIDRSLMSGVRYALHSPVIRTVLVRVVTFGLVVAPGPALAPLVAKQVLQGDGLVLGILLGAQGVGAVVAALLVSRIRAALQPEVAIRWLTLGSGLSLATIGFSQSLMVTTGAFVVFGSCYITTLATLNIDLQLSISRWVVARVLSLFSSATFIGLGAGAYIWGLIADAHSVGLAFVCAGTAAIASIGLGLILPLKKPASKDQSDAGIQSGLAICMDLTLRSGPIVIEVVYDVDPKVAREFYNAILQLQPMRERIGGYKWSMARNVSDLRQWTERYHCSTWGDYLRMLDRYSQGDVERQLRINAYHCGESVPLVTRKLERPYGSVRWKADAFDGGEELTGYRGPLGPF